MGRLGHGDRERDLLRLLPLILLAGVFLGTAEWLYHRSGPAPVGPLRHNGVSYPAFLAVSTFAFLLLPSVTALLLRRGSGGRVALLWFLALFPSAWVLIDHLSRFSHLPLLHYHHPRIFVVETCALALLASVVGAWACTRPSLRYLRGRVSLPPGANWFILLLVVSLWLFGFPAPGQPLEPGGEAGEDAPCVLLLSIDTLRRDDATGPRAPFLAELASRGVTIQGWAPSPWTRPSMASLFSGVAPTGHGAGKYTAVDSGVNWWPELLADAGWRTKAIVSNPHLERGLGFGRGFRDFDHSSHLERLEPAAQMVWVRWLSRQLQEGLDRGDRLVGRAVHWLGSRPRGPWLLWVHLIDPHVPYHPRGPAGELADEGDASWREALRPYLQDGAVRDVRMLRAAADTMPIPARQALREIYRREVSFVDRQLAELFQAAEAAAGERGLYWMVTSDHGEEFFEHAGLEHGHTLYDELLRVPMLMGGPGLPPGSAARGFRLEDLGPTLLGLMGRAPMELRARGGEAVEDLLRPYVFGRDRSGELLHATPGDSCVGVRMIAENLLYGDPKTRLLEPDGSSWLRDDDDGRYYALQSCEGEPAPARPLEAESLPPHAATVLDALDRWRSAAEADESVRVEDPALEQRLRSLGYID